MVKDKKKFIINNFGKKEYEGLMTKRKNQLEFNDFQFYKVVKVVRQGGLTCLNPTILNKFIEYVFSIDITSSYPYIMCFKKFPRYEKSTTIIKRVEDNMISEEKLKVYEESTELFKNLLLKGKTCRTSTIKGFIGEISLSNVKIKEHNEKCLPLLPISIAKLLDCENVESINGKLISADNIRIYVNDIDYEQILLCYDFEFTACYELYISTKEEYLSLAEISFIMDLFVQKQKIKPFKDELVAEYMHIKGNINANYGKKQQDFLKGFAEVLNGTVSFFESEDIISDDKLGKTILENHSDDCFGEIDIMTDGMYISSKAKLRLLEMMDYLFKVEENFNKQNNTNFEVIIAYSDTDSLKFFTKEKEDEIFPKKSSSNNDLYFFNNIILQAIKKYNKNITISNKKCYRFKDFLDKFSLQENDKNVKEILELGTWDIENNKDENGNYIPFDFKSLGAKKYIILDKDIKTTIAGCSADLGDELTKYCIKNNLDMKEFIIDFFRKGTRVDRSISGRTVAYKETRTHEEISKIIYKGTVINGFGCKMIENTDYTLGVTDNDLKYYWFLDEDEEKVERVFLKCENGDLIFLEKDEDVKQYLIDAEKIHKKYIYKKVGVLNENY